ncbi:MAG: hypothetical protein K0R72_214 [Clostridia bacterium]|nr:hypothetical protein [Clostridia bacterium]
MNFKGRNQMRLLILGLVLIIAIIVVIVVVNNNNAKSGNEVNGTDNTKVNYTQTSDGTKVNTSEELSKDKKVEGVLLEQSKIVYTNGTSKLTSKVTNDSAAKDNLRFKVKFIANDGSVMAEAIGYVGKIKANETKYIDSYITIDTSNSKNVIYEVLK